MKIAILSDIHDHLLHLQAALKRSQEAAVVLCCGDLCSPFIAKELALGFAKPIHIVFGNNDGDRYRIAMNSAKYPQLQFHGEFVELTLDGKSFAVNHFDHIGRALANSEAYDVVCFGHNHRFEITPQGRSLIINPGEIFGCLTGHATFVLYDTSSGTAERIDLP